MPSGRRRAFTVLFGVTCTAAAGNTALMSVLPAIGREFGLSDTLVAAAFALSALFWMLTSAMWARLSDTHGRKRMILIGMAGFTASMIAFALSTSAGLAGWLPVLAAFVAMTVSRSIYGVFGSAVPTAAQAYIADRTSRRERTEAMAVQASAQGLGTVLGPAIAPFFVLPLVGLAGPMYLFTALGLVALWVVWTRLPSGDVKREPVGRPVKGKGLWRDPRVVPFLGYAGLAISVQAINISVLGFHVIDEIGLEPLRAQAFVGIAMLAGAGASLLAQWALIPMFHMGPKALLRWGAGLGLAGNLLAALAPDYYGVVIGYAVASLGAGFARPGFMAGASLAVGPRAQGEVAGLITALAGFCFLLPPVLGVGLYELWGPLPYLLNGVMMAGALAMAFGLSALAHAGEEPATDQAIRTEVKARPPV